VNDGLERDRPGRHRAMSMRRIVVTGASGNVGTGVLRALAAQLPDAQVVGVCRRPPPAGTPHYDRVEWHAVDLSAPGAVEGLGPALRGADAVVHLAWAIQPVRAAGQLYRANVEGTRSLLRAVTAAGIDRLVVASSLGAYAPGATIPVDERWPVSGQRSSTYSRHKVQLEAMLDRFEREHPGVAVARIRPTLVVQREAATEIRSLFLGRAGAAAGGRAAAARTATGPAAAGRDRAAVRARRRRR
jgi:UDP-glucose 4-epimerase